MLRKLKLVLLLLVFMAICGGVIFSYFWITDKFSDKEISVNLPSENTTKPWIEVVASKVFEIDKNNNVKKELFTGDELSSGIKIGVDKNGLANIYFPDGSVARIDSNTEFILDEANFENKSGKLVVKINLIFGKIWSKIVTLATPDSDWEVKTSTAVATVRGTAFGMEYQDGKSTVIGSENKVVVSAVDPETKEVLKQVSVEVSTDRIIEIKKEDAERIKSHIAIVINEAKTGVVAVATPVAQKLLEVKEAPVKVLAEKWVKKAKEQDEKINEKLNELKERKAEIKEIRKEINKTIREEVKERVIEFQKQKEELIQSSKENLKDLMREVPKFLPEELPKILLNNLPDKIPAPLMNLIPEKAQPAVEELMKNPEELKTQIEEKWDIIREQTIDSAASVSPAALIPSVEESIILKPTDNTTTR